MLGGPTSGPVASRRRKHPTSLQVLCRNHLLYPPPQYSAGPTASAPGKDASRRVDQFRRVSKYTAATAEWVSTHLLYTPWQTVQPNPSTTGSRSVEMDGS